MRSLFDDSPILTLKELNGWKISSTLPDLDVGSRDDFYPAAHRGACQRDMTET
jgi:hypothetical protein